MDCCESGLYEVLKKIEEDGLTPVNKQLLSVLLPQNLLTRVYETLRDNAIQLSIARESGRSVWTITTKNGTYYQFIEPDNRYCSCLSFSNDVLKNGKIPFCKHVIACLICDSLRKRGAVENFSVKNMEDKEFSRFIGSVVMSNSMFNTSTHLP